MEQSNAESMTYKLHFDDDCSVVIGEVVLNSKTFICNDLSITL